MEQLPDDVLMLIMDHLPNAEVCQGPAHVCQRWARLAERRALHVRGPADRTRLHAGLAALLVTTRLRLAEPLSVARNLRELCVGAVLPLGEDELAALNHLPRLDHLDVFLSSRIAEAHHAPLFARLESVVLNETVAPRFLRALQPARRLRALHMFGRSLYYPRKELAPLLAARRDHLRELTLRCTELHDKAYLAISECVNLESLQLYSCWLMTAAGALLAVRPPRLRRVHVTGARMVRSRALSAMLVALPLGVTELVLSATWFSDVHSAELRARLPRLRSLELWRCRVTARGLVELAGALPELRELDTDLPLGERHVRQLAEHPALVRLRAMPVAAAALDLEAALGADEVRFVPRAGADCALRVSRADARYALGSLRGGSEGYAADLFYHWSQGTTLPLAREAPYPHEFSDTDIASSFSEPRPPKHRTSAAAYPV